MPFIKRTTLWDSTTLSRVDFSSGVRAVPGHKQTDSAINKSVTSRILPLMVCGSKEKEIHKKEPAKHRTGRRTRLGAAPGRREAAGGRRGEWKMEGVGRRWKREKARLEGGGEGREKRGGTVVEARMDAMASSHARFLKEPFMPPQG